MKKNILKDVENLLVLKTWHASVFVLPLSNRLALYISNYTDIKPNQITITAFLLRICVGFLFLNGSHIFLVAGAFFYYIAYVLDCTDGLVARLTEQTSELGRYLDHILDLVGDIWVLCFLALGSYDDILNPMIVGMGFMHIAESYISYLAGLAIKNNNANSKSFILEKFNRYRKWWFDRNYKSFLSFPDYAAFLFIFIPIIGKAEYGLKIGFYLLFIIVCYTIISTLASLHTCEKRFP